MFICKGSSFSRGELRRFCDGPVRPDAIRQLSTKRGSRQRRTGERQLGHPSLKVVNERSGNPLRHDVGVRSLCRRT